MKLIQRLILKLISSPKIDMRTAYRLVRGVQELIFPLPTDRYRFTDHKIYAEDGSHEIPIRIFEPKEKRSSELLLFIHGGGWVIGDVDTYTSDCIKLADQAGRTVLAVDYLKAPEYPFPAGFDDCYRVAELLINQPELAGMDDAWRVTLIGNSAGANLAAAVSLRLRDEGKDMPFKQVLINPVTYWNHDERSPFPSVEENGHDYGLTAKKLQEYMEMYEPNEEKRKHPYVAPLMAEDFSDQPETLIISSELDPLRDEGELYGKLLRRAGNQVRIMRANDTVHNYLFGPITDDSVQASYELIENFLENPLKGRVTRGEQARD